MTHQKVSTLGSHAYPSPPPPHNSKLRAPNPTIQHISVLREGPSADCSGVPSGCSTQKEMGNRMGGLRREMGWWRETGRIKKKKKMSRRGGYSKEIGCSSGKKIKVHPSEKRKYKWRGEKPGAEKEISHGADISQPLRHTAIEASSVFFTPSSPLGGTMIGRTRNSS